MGAVMLCVGAVLFMAPAAGAAAGFASYFAAGGGAAGETQAVGSPSGSRLVLELRLAGAGSSAGFLLSNDTGRPPDTAPSFSFNPSASGASMGSPRLVIFFSDGDYIALSPAAWTANTWTQVNGAGPNWSDAGHGHRCAALIDATYQQALACHNRDGARVERSYVVADSAPVGGVVTVLVDQVSYGGADATAGLTVQAAVRFQINRVSVNAVTGVGGVSAPCGFAAGDHCHFDLSLMHGGVSIGTITGTADGVIGGQVHVALTSRGRSLLKPGHSLGVIAAGTIVNDVGFGFRLRQPMTVHRRPFLAITR